MKFFRLLIFLIFIGCTSNSLAQTVYTTKTGEKYHTATCHYLKYSKKEIALEQAINLGYQACSVCKPGSNPNKIQSLVSKSNKTTPPQETAAQCTSKTKAGKRCKRMTKNASGRCYQHE